MKKTQINYKSKNNFFGPGPGSMNKLGESNNGLMHNFFARIGEWLYKQYDRIKELFRTLNKFLFPRREKIWGHVHDSYLTGRLVHASRYTPRSPIRHIKLEFWARTKWWQWRNIASGFSDDEGYFNLPFDLRAARNWAVKSKLRLEIHHTSDIYFG